MRVLGVDACKAGWVAISLPATSAGRAGRDGSRPDDRDGRDGSRPDDRDGWDGRDRLERGEESDGADGPVRAYLAATIQEVVAAAGPVDVVGIDIPIGLPDRGHRAADVLARAAAGPRRASVFLTPVRTALTAPSHADAVTASRRASEVGVSMQAYRLGPKILQVDAWVREAGTRVVEVHPELSFAAMAGAPLSEPKATWAGATRRRRLLADAGVVLPDDLGPAGEAAVDDVLDAAAAAWSARRVALGEATSRPDPPQVHDDGLPAAIWT